MPRRAKGLSAAKVQKAGPGRYGDGGGLYLLVRAPEAKFWVFRYVRAGRMREIGLGSASGRTAVSLADARMKARALYDMHREGRDPLDERAAGRAAQDAEAAKAVKFSEAAERYIEAHRAGWRSPKHAAQWEATLATYVYPIVGALPVRAIDTALVMRTLEPIWNTKSETASRVRGRIESVLDWAKARGYRDGENPARWKGHLDNLLPARSKVRSVVHLAALPYDQAPSFMAALRAEDDIVARSLEFIILCASRVGEAIGAQWDEIDLKSRQWVIPGSRMKSDREHRVALSTRAVKILKDLERTPGDGRVFAQLPKQTSFAFSKILNRLGQPDVTVHGFRATFRSWAAERTSYPSEVAELSLAHAVGDAVTRAYQRSDMFAKRLRLMDEWATYCAQPPSTGERVVPIRKRKALESGAPR